MNNEGQPYEPDSAVALFYDGDNAPTVTAKGEGDLAKEIVQIAQEHGVPLHQDAALTAFLSSLDIGEEIPRMLYVAVAKVIAFAYYIDGKLPPRPSADSDQGRIID